jgi:hypothetical protein
MDTAAVEQLIVKIGRDPRAVMTVRGFVEAALAIGETVNLRSAFGAPELEVIDILGEQAPCKCCVAWACSFHSCTRLAYLHIFRCSSYDVCVLAGSQDPQ